MKNIRLMIASLSLLLSVSAPALLATQPAAAATTGQNCTVSVSGTENSENGPNSDFRVANGVATVTVVVGGSLDCTETVNLTSYRAPVGATGFTPYASQTRFANNTVDVAYGAHNVSVKVPTDCAYQVDLSNSGFNPATQGAGDYTFGNLIAYDTNFTGVCPAPTPPVTPPTVPTPTPPAATPTTPAATPVAQPTTLVNTGPGNVAELFALVAVAGAIAHRTIVRKMLNR